MTWPELPDQFLVADLKEGITLLNRVTGRAIQADEMASFIIRARHSFVDRRAAIVMLSQRFNEKRDVVDRDLRRLEAAIASNTASNDLPPKRFVRNRLSRYPQASPPDRAPHRVFEVDAVGHDISVASYDEHITASLDAHLQAFKPGTGHGTRIDVWRTGLSYYVAARGRQLSQEPTLEFCLFRFSGLLTSIAADYSPNSPLLHAAGVSVRDNAIVLAGHSNQGKSSTTAELLTQGKGYLSDEIIALDLANRVASGLPRPLGIEGRYQACRPDLRPPEAVEQIPNGRWSVPPGRVGSVARTGRLAILVLLHLDGENSVRKLTTSEALSAVWPHLYRRDELDSLGVSELVRVLGLVPTYEVHHDGAQRAAAFVSALATGL